MGEDREVLGGGGNCLDVDASRDILDVDADPEEEEEGAEAHEEAGHGRDHHLLGDVPGELGGGHLEYRGQGGDHDGGAGDRHGIHGGDDDDDSEDGGSDANGSVGYGDVDK